MLYNLSPTREKYYSQRNNLIKPTIRCKPTGTVEALDIAGWPLPTGSHKQPEDNLTAFCEVTWGADAPEDWWYIAAAINGKFLPAEKPLIGPRWDWDLKDVLWGIIQGNPFAASTWLTNGGHVVVIVGFETAQVAIPTKDALDIYQVSTIIIDDPYGDRTTGEYRSQDGWNCRYSLSAWLPLWRRIGVQIRRKQ